MAHKDSYAATSRATGKPTVKGFGEYGRTDFHSLPGGRHVTNFGSPHFEPDPYPLPDYLDSDWDRNAEPDDVSTNRTRRRG